MPHAKRGPPNPIHARNRYREPQEPDDDGLYRDSHGSCCSLDDLSDPTTSDATASFEADSPTWKQSFIFVSTQILGERIPWEMAASDEKIQVHYPISWGRSELRWEWMDIVKRDVWGLTQVALSGLVDEEAIFRIPQNRESPTFTLRPAVRSSIPLQWIHIGPHAIPDTLANLDCTRMSSADLLRELNYVFRTNHRLNTAGVLALLEDVRRSSRDFGEIYGKVRQCWRRPGTIKALYKKQCAREAQHEALRRKAIFGFGLSSSHIPPRRVWDLYSNRVLPLAVIPSDDPEPSNIPDGLVTISHSWVAEADRADLWTPVNGKQWPVPFPRATTLEHVRVELLNMGLEYVWLDVLCLRQQGQEEDEARRREEWKIDVPTIGYVYQGQPQVDHRACVIYFNGLGLPLDTSPAALESGRHWFSRAWTLQESLEHWAPGGLTGQPLVEAGHFMDRLRAAVTMGTEVGPIRRLVPDVAREIMRRGCTKALDRIAGLAYCLECDTLPLYDEAVDAERAWKLLLKHMQTGIRTRISLLCAARHAPYALFPSWAEYATGAHSQQNLTSHGSLWLVDEKQRFTARPGMYYNEGIVFGPCRFSLVRSQSGTTGLKPKLRVSPVGREAQGITLQPRLIHGVVLEDVSYSLVRWSGDDWRTPLCWAVVEEFIRREVPEPLVIVARSAVMLLEYDDNKSLQELWTTDAELEREWAVKYCSGELALGKSQHRERYMQALETVRASGETFLYAR